MSLLRTLLGIGTMALVLSAVAEDAPPSGPDILEKGLPPGTSCQLQIAYPSLEKRDPAQAAAPLPALPITVTFYSQTADRIERLTLNADQTRTRQYLVDNLILRESARGGVGVESLATAQPDIRDSFNPYGAVQWVSPENFTKIQTRDGKKCWAFEAADPALGARLALIEIASRRPVFYQDKSRRIQYTFNRQSRDITIPEPLQRARKQFLNTFPDGVGQPQN